MKPLRGSRVTVRDMRRQDMAAMAGWRPFADPLYQPFDLPRRSLAEHYSWFDARQGDPTRRLYTVEDEHGRVIGSMTLREMDGQRSARLGITLGADFVSRGYGTEALALFLGYYFGTLGMSQMVLDVAATNERAVRSYESLGFRRVAQHFEPGSHPSYRIILRDPQYRHLRRYFRRQGGLMQVLFFDMTLRREWWLEASRELVIQP